MAGIDIEHLKQQQAKLHHVADRGIPTTLAAKEAASTIPIVMAALGDPVGSGIIPGPARPGGNVTGLSAFLTEPVGSALN
jgi:putative ABC transport system substrate-binding protein